jgi:hypothetical protein
MYDDRNYRRRYRNRYRNPLGGLAAGIRLVTRLCQLRLLTRHLRWLI